MKRISAVLRILLGIVFVIAGSMKIFNPWRFHDTVTNFRILSDPLAQAAAFYIPWLEVVLGLALIARKLYRGALASSGLLLSIFTAVLLSAQLRGLDTSCGCFGSWDMSLNFEGLLARNIGLLIVTGFLIRAER